MSNHRKSLKSKSNYILAFEICFHINLRFYELKRNSKLKWRVDSAIYMYSSQVYLDIIKREFNADR